MKKCLTCKNEFEKGKIVGGHLGLAWIIFIFLSMGIGFIVWLFFRGEKKEICPYCKSENIIDMKFYNNNSDSSNRISTQSIEAKNNKKDLKTKRTWKDYFGAVFSIFIIIVIINSIGNKKINSKEEIEQLSVSIKSIPSIQIEENYRGYKKLSEYYPQNSKYEKKMNFYKTRLDFVKECTLLAYKNNVKSLNNQSTYSSVNLDGYYLENLVDVNTLLYQSSFRGKNSFGIESTYVTKYRCTYNNKDRTFILKRLSLKKVK